MSREEEIEQAIEDLEGYVDQMAGDSKKWSQAESVEIYQTLAQHCSVWAETIQSEM